MTNLAFGKKPTPYLTSVKKTTDNVANIGHHFIQEEFEAYLGTKTSNTALNYRGDLIGYFNLIFNKSVEHVTLDDIINTKSLHSSRFFAYLKNDAVNLKHGATKEEDKKGFKNATIKRSITAVRGFYKFLRVDYPAVNAYIFDNLSLESEELDVKGYDNLEWHEVEIMAEYALKQRMEGYQMGMLIKLASITSIRLDALLSLEWEKHFYQKEENGVIIDYIEVVDKKQMHKKPISKNLIVELQEKLGSDGKPFYSLNKNKVGDYIKEILKALEFDVRRNITFHSLKKAGVNRVLDLTGDLIKAQQQGNHKSIATTEKAYIKRKESLSAMSSYTLDQSIDIVGTVSQFSKEDILMALGNISDSAKFELMRALQTK